MLLVKAPISIHLKSIARGRTLPVSTLLPGVWHLSVGVSSTGVKKLSTGVSIFGLGVFSTGVARHVGLLLLRGVSSNYKEGMEPWPTGVLQPTSASSHFSSSGVSRPPPSLAHQLRLCQLFSRSLAPSTRSTERKSTQRPCRSGATDHPH